jgi:hypothetical protein
MDLPGVHAGPKTVLAMPVYLRSGYAATTEESQLWQNGRYRLDLVGGTRSLKIELKLPWLAWLL